MSNNVVQKETGLSLVEVLVALTILTIGLLATAGMQITALQSNAGAHKMTTINTAASGIIEEILTWDPADPRLVVADPAVAYVWDFDPTAAVNNTLTVKGGGSFVAEYFVNKDFPVEKVSTIRVVVTSAGGLSSWGGNIRELSCLKKTQ